jgi:ABC-type phosphate transport system substrate-binding protein
MLKAQNDLRRSLREGLGRALALSILSAGLWLLAGPVAPSSAAEPFQVVVHVSNPVSVLSAQEVSKMFLKKVSRWEGGGRVLPVDLEDRSAVREAFSQRVHAKGTVAIKAFWQRMIFSGRDVPPPEMKTVREVLDYVRDHPGAIGYVPAGTGLVDGVKPIRVAP